MACSHPGEHLHVEILVTYWVRRDPKKGYPDAKKYSGTFKVENSFGCNGNMIRLSTKTFTFACSTVKELKDITVINGKNKLAYPDELGNLRLRNAGAILLSETIYEFMAKLNKVAPVEIKSNVSAAYRRVGVLEVQLVPAAKEYLALCCEI